MLFSCIRLNGISQKGNFRKKIKCGRVEIAIAKIYVMISFFFWADKYKRLPESKQRYQYQLLLQAK